MNKQDKFNKKISGRLSDVIDITQKQSELSGELNDALYRKACGDKKVFEKLTNILQKKHINDTEEFERLAFVTSSMQKIIKNLSYIVFFQLWVLLFVFGCLFLLKPTIILITLVVGWFNLSIDWWSSLSEGWQIAFTAMPIAIITGVIVWMITIVIKKKFKYFNLDKDINNK